MSTILIGEVGKNHMRLEMITKWYLLVSSVFFFSGQKPYFQQSQAAPAVKGQEGIYAKQLRDKQRGIKTVNCFINLNQDLGARRQDHGPRCQEFGCHNLVYFDLGQESLPGVNEKLKLDA